MPQNFKISKTKFEQKKDTELRFRTNFTKLIEKNFRHFISLADINLPFLERLEKFKFFFKKFDLKKSKKITELISHEGSKLGKALFFQEKKRILY